MAVRSLSARPSVQVLGGVRLRTGPQGLEIAATDMETSVRTVVSAQVEQEGAAVVPGRVVAELARVLPGEEVVVEESVAERALWIRSGHVEYRLQTLALADFPRLPEVDDGSLAMMATGPLLEGITRVARAVGRDDSRPVLTGIFTRIREGKLTMAATDSYRLAVYESEAGGDGIQLEAIVPARALEEVRRLASASDEVRMGVVDSHLAFRIGPTLLTTRRIDGQFPDYRNLAPKLEEYTLEARLPRLELVDAIRRVSVVAQRGSPLRLCFHDRELVLSVQAQDVGEARETMPVAFTGGDLDIGFNPDFLRDGVEAVAGDEVVLRLINPLRPGLIEAETEGYWYLLMPIRLAG